jgi:Lon protease-like protein
MQTTSPSASAAVPSTQKNNAWIPLFPLNAVLFPNGILPLRVFETRYIDMVKECMKSETPFGVVLIRSGQEVGAPADPEDVGCMAHIENWDMEDAGILTLRTRGGERFRILGTRVSKDNRLEARIETFSDDASPNITSAHMACAKALKIVTDDINAKGKAEHGSTFISPFGAPQFEDASWVANRWCELLPIPLKARQKLLELNNAQNRLTIVHQYLQQHKII